MRQSCWPGSASTSAGTPGLSTVGSACISMNEAHEDDLPVRMAEHMALKETVSYLVNVVEDLQSGMALSMSLISRLSGKLGSVREDDDLKAQQKSLDDMYIMFSKGSAGAGAQSDEGSSFCPQALEQPSVMLADDSCISSKTRMPIADEDLSFYPPVLTTIPVVKPALTPMKNAVINGPSRSTPRPEGTMSTPSLPYRSLRGHSPGLRGHSPGPARTPHVPGSVPHPQRCPMSPLLCQRPLSPMAGAVHPIHDLVVKEPIREHLQWKRNPVKESVDSIQQQPHFSKDVLQQSKDVIQQPHVSNPSPLWGKVSGKESPDMQHRTLWSRNAGPISAKEVTDLGGTQRSPVLTHRGVCVDRGHCSPRVAPPSQWFPVARAGMCTPMPPGDVGVSPC